VLYGLQHFEVDAACLFRWNLEEVVPLHELIPRSLRTFKLTTELYSRNEKYQWQAVGMRKYFEKHQASIERGFPGKIVIGTMSLENTTENVHAVQAILKGAGIALRMYVEQDVRRGKVSDRAQPTCAQMLTATVAHLIVSRRQF
jgi:hypothetical protein